MDQLKEHFFNCRISVKFRVAEMTDVCFGGVFRRGKVCEKAGKGGVDPLFTVSVPVPIPIFHCSLPLFLCPDLFAFKEDKYEFAIFDFCENFEFFNNFPEGIKAKATKSVSQRLFELRLRLAVVLEKEEDKELNEYATTIIDYLFNQTLSLNTESFIVRQHWEVVEKYRDRNSWNALNDADHGELNREIAPLMTETDQDEFSKRFDVMMFELQLSLINGTKNQEDLIEKVRGIGGQLSKKATIPAVAKKLETITKIRDKHFWEAATVTAVEKIREELRELIKFLDKDYNPIYFTNFADDYDGEVKEHEILKGINNLEAYKRTVENYLRENTRNLIISKLRNNTPVTKSEIEELEKMLFNQGTFGTKEKFVEVFGEKPLGTFIRSIVGLDAGAAKQAFSDLLSNQTLNSHQIRFIDMIINYLTVKGTIDPAMLFEAPFTDLSSTGIMGLFDQEQAEKIVEMIERVNGNAVAA